MSKTLLVVGMHRSGTSVTANWLAACGLFLGDDLIEANYSNPTGHYEDIHISSLQRQILKDNGLHQYLVSSNHPIVTTQAHRQEAETLLAGYADKGQWGWKDPRTALLLPFWHELLPDMKCLIVYRHYTQVVDSLLRRERSTSLQKKVRIRRPVRIHRMIRNNWIKLYYSSWNIPLVNKYLRVWQRYNEALLDYAAQHPDDVYSVDIDDLIAVAPTLREAMNTQWDFQLNDVDIRTVYKPKFLQQERQHTIGWIRRIFAPACEDVYDRLNALSKQTYEKIQVADVQP